MKDFVKCIPKIKIEHDGVLKDVLLGKMSKHNVLAGIVNPKES